MWCITKETDQGQFHNFLSEWCRCGADMKKARMGSTKAYIPFGLLIEASQMRHYHKKLKVFDVLILNR